MVSKREARRREHKKLVQRALKKQGTTSRPAPDMSEYPPIPGMEGPFTFRSGKILYYDPKAGRYYDRKTDMYLPRDADPMNEAQNQTHTSEDYDMDHDDTVEAFDEMTEDEQFELFECITIDEIEEQVLEAIVGRENEFVTQLDEVSRLANEGEFEMAFDVAVDILEAAGLDEEQLDELKKGFKFSAAARAKIKRVKKKVKTGSQRMKLKMRRKEARKPAERKKRERFRKINKARIDRRRKQLGNSTETDAVTQVDERLDADTVSAMTDAGFTHAVVVEGEEPLFLKDEESARDIAEDEDGEVIDLDEYGPQLGGGKQQIAGQIAAFLRDHPDVTYGELATRFKIGRDVAQQVMLSVSKFTSAYAGSPSTGDITKHLMTLHLPQVGAVMASDESPAGGLSEAERDTLSQTLDNLRKAGLMEEAALIEEKLGLDEADDDLTEGELETVVSEVAKNRKKGDDGQRGSKPKYQGQKAADGVPEDDVQHEAHNAARESDDETYSLSEAEKVTKDQDTKAAMAGMKKAGIKNLRVVKLSKDQRWDGPGTVWQKGRKVVIGDHPTLGLSVWQDDLSKPQGIFKHEFSESVEESIGDGDTVEISFPYEQADELIEAAKEAGLDSSTNVRVRDRRIVMQVPTSAAEIINSKVGVA